MTLDKITDAERIWRDAYERHNRHSTDANYRAEQDAWDAYAELCDEARQCLTVGCRNISPEYAYCQQHRGWAYGFGKDRIR